ncbi:MAG TPA: NTP transferase domain-containing protein [Croceibacterium sp.]|nr:NTP transferase domain-containing protein [Croceibacterium sp.]
MPEPPVVVILLAGQRAGAINPLAARARVSHKCLVPIRGKPLLIHVLDTVTALPAVSEIRISVEAEAHDELRPLLADYAGGPPIRLVASRPKLIESVVAAAGDDEGPFLVTTADNVLVTPAAAAQIRREMTEADGVFALARKDDVLAAHPEAQRGFYRFRDGEFANCNIYGLANRKTFPVAADVFAGGGQFMKSARRMIDAFGLHNIVLLRLGVFGVKAAMRRLSRRTGIEIRATIFTDGSLAVDVDNERTYRVCEELLVRREGRATD